MERLKVDELIANAGRKADGSKITQTELGLYVFKGERGRPRNGKRHMLSATRKMQLISAWNNGAQLTRLRPAHLLRVAEFFEVTDIRQLIQA